MARGSSTILVNIVGDAKGLQSELREADKGIAKLGNVGKAAMVGLAAGGIAVAADALIDFGRESLQQADRLGDATARMELQLGDLSGALVDTAGEFTNLGLSAQDVLELEAAVADTATALGVANPRIAEFADEAAATAGAVALLGDQDAATVVDLIGKAAAGSEKALRALGVNLSDAEVEARALRDTGKGTADSLTDGELAAAAYALILEKLAPKLSAVTDGSNDMEQATGRLGAKIETLQGQVGTVVDEALAPMLDVVLDATDAIDDMDISVGDFGRTLKALLGPIGQAIDGLANLLDIARALASIELPFGAGPSSGPAPNPGVQGGGSSGSKFGPQANASQNVTVNVNGGDPAEVEASVKRALQGYYDRNGALLTD